MAEDEWQIGEVRKGMVRMREPTPEQIVQWRKSAEDTQRRLLAGEFDYPNPLLERIKELELRVEALEKFPTI